MDDIDSTITLTQGGVTLQEIYDSQISIGEIIGRDKIVIQNISQRAVTTAEEARIAEDLEMQRLAQGISAFVETLQYLVLADTGSSDLYKGLYPYRLSDAQFFFGRERAVTDLRRHLRLPLTVLHSESGAGKTSLLQAGVAPRLIAAGHLPLYIRSYDADPALKIKNAFIADLSRTPKLAESPLRSFLQQVCLVIGPQTILFVFVDQFEEFFARVDDPSRARFVKELAACLDDESLALQVHWVFALRGESLTRLSLEFHPAIANPLENQYALRQLSPEEARQAIIEPAARRGLRFEDNLAGDILQDLLDLNRETAQVAPPQIQLVCATLIEALPGGQKVVSAAAYQAIGGARGILQGHLERALKRTGQRPVAQWVLEALTTSDARRIIKTHRELAAELGYYGVKPDVLDKVLSQLIDSRLLLAQKAESEMDGEVEYELAHDYVLNEIKLDSAVRTRKEAEELLAQGVRNWKNLGILPGVEALAVIEKQSAALHPSNIELELLLHSAVEHKRRLDVWVTGLPPASRGPLIRQIALGLTHSNRKAGRRTAAILWAMKSDLPPETRKTVSRWRFAQQAVALAKWSLILLILLNVLFVNSPATPPWQEITPVNIARGAGPLMVAASQTNPELIYVSDQTPGGLYRSTNGGLDREWQSVGMAIPNQPLIRDVAATDRTVYVTTTAGLFVSKDAGNSWRALAASLKQEPWAVAVTLEDPESLYISLAPGGLLGTQDGGGEWSPVGLPPEAREVLIQAIAAYEQNIIIAAGHDMWFSLDAGQTWAGFEAQPTVPDPVEGLTIVGRKGRFWAALGRSGLYDADIKAEGGHGFWRQLENRPGETLIHSVSAVGDAAFYVAGEQAVFCRRAWFWPDPNWLRANLRLAVPCAQK